MIRQNQDRNRALYHLWSEGRTIDEASLLAGTARSTVGYYFRKFNRASKRGEPIAIGQPDVKPNNGDMAMAALIKSSLYIDILEAMKDPAKLDWTYKILSVLKLIRDLQKDIFPTREEANALWKSLGKIYGTTS